MINENLLLAAVGIMNLVNTITNIIYISVSKKMQINKELLSELTEQSKAKDELIKSIKLDKKNFQRQYENILSRYNELEGRFKQINNEPLRVINQSLTK